VRRLTAAKEKRSWTDAQKKHVASTLRPELMSSVDDEDSDKEDSALMVKALPWRRDALNQFVKELNIKSAALQTECGKRQQKNAFSAAHLSAQSQRTCRRILIRPPS
jgi:vacuolar-type H+-ATPase subunit I/STV1